MYRRFIKNFLKIAHPLCKLHEKECQVYFDESCVKAFGELKEKLVSAPTIISRDWIKQFKVICDASEVAPVVIFGQRRGKILPPTIYYASKALNEAQKNYTVTEQELFAVVFMFDKFRFYFRGTRVIMHTDHFSLIYLMAKKYVKPSLIRWVLLL